MISKHAGIAVASLFQALRVAASGAMLTGAADPGARRVGEQQSMMMAAQMEGHRRATSEAIAKQQNLDRMRAHTQAQLGIGLAQQGMGYNPMLSGGGGGANAAPFVAWSAQRG